MSKTSTKKIIEPIDPKMNNEFDNDKDFSFEPENSVIKNILNYSKALSVRKSKSIAHIELVLN